MPDIITVLTRHWKQIAALTFAATILAFLVCLVSPKKYKGMVTALAANPALGDKARIFNQNIEELYTALGTPDDLDKIEGTAKLDTVFIALAQDFNLVAHYGLNSEDTAALYHAMYRLKKNAAISRTGYGELRIEIWDEDNYLAAALANAALQKLNDIHQQVLTENNRVILQRLKEDYFLKQKALQLNADTGFKLQGKQLSNITADKKDSLFLSKQFPKSSDGTIALQTEQLAQYTRMINEYELAVKTTPNMLLPVEKARPSPLPDKPKTTQVVALAFLAALLFSLLLAFYSESRKQRRDNHF